MSSFFKVLWIGRGGFGLLWRNVEHQFYRDMDGSMGKRWTHYATGRVDDAAINAWLDSITPNDTNPIWRNRG